VAQVGSEVFHGLLPVIGEDRMNKLVLPKLFQYLHDLL
jgi:hypothetical protein